MSIIYDLGLGLFASIYNLVLIFGGLLIMTWLIGKDF